MNASDFGLLGTAPSHHLFGPCAPQILPLPRGGLHLLRGGA